MIRLLLLPLVLVALAQTNDPPVCDGPTPWRCGPIEHACSRTGQPWPGDTTRPENWHVCECLHGCDKTNKESGGRKWDPKCTARCNPNHCHCPHPCEET